MAKEIQCNRGEHLEPSVIPDFGNPPVVLQHCSVKYTWDMKVSHIVSLCCLPRGLLSTSQNASFRVLLFSGSRIMGPIIAAPELAVAEVRDELAR